MPGLSMGMARGLNPNYDCKPALGNGSHDLGGIYFAQYRGYPFSGVTGFGRLNVIYRHFRDSAQTLMVATNLLEADPPLIGYRFMGSDVMMEHMLELPVP
jgi:hypothetical protein